MSSSSSSSLSTFSSFFASLAGVALSTGAAAATANLDGSYSKINVCNYNCLNNYVRLGSILKLNFICYLKILFESSSFFEFNFSFSSNSNQVLETIDQHMRSRTSCWIADLETSSSHLSNSLTT